MKHHLFYLQTACLLLASALTLPALGSTTPLGSGFGLYNYKDTDSVARPDGSILVAHDEWEQIVLGTSNHEFLFDLASGKPLGTFLKGVNVSDRTMYASDITADGKLYLGGGSGDRDFKKPGSLYKVNPDGTSDTSFQAPPLPSAITAISIAKDGTDSVWVAGPQFLFRLSGSGVIQSTLVGIESMPQALLPSLDSTGKPTGSVIIAGHDGIHKVSASGVVDPSFDSNFKPKLIDLYGLTRVSDGVLITARIQNVFQIIKINDLGVVDSSFSSGQGFNGGISVVASTDGSGSIYVGGTFGQYDGNATQTNIVRLTHDGLLDLDFAPTISGYDLVQLSMNSKGQLISFGVFYGGDNRGTDYIAYAVIDQSGKLLQQQTRAYSGDSPISFFQELQDGRIFAYGSAMNEIMYEVTSPGLTILNSDGSFNSETPGVGGNITGVPGHPDTNLIHEGYRWSLLTGSQQTPIPALGYVHHVIALENGNYVTESGGTVSMYGSNLQPLPSFKLKDLFQDVHYVSIAPVLGDPSRFWIAGDLSFLGNKAVGSVLQMNSDGKIAKSFGFKGGSAVVTSDDFKTVWVENATQKANGEAEFIFYRYTPNGDRQAQFNVSDACKAIPNNKKVEVKDFQPSDDGSVYVFAICSSSSYGQYVLTRFTADGVLDKGFQLGALSARGEVLGFTPVPDSSGDIVIFGSFMTYAGQPRYGIAQIRKDGTLR